MGSSYRSPLALVTEAGRWHQSADGLSRACTGCRSCDGGADGGGGGGAPSDPPPEAPPPVENCTGPGNCEHSTSRGTCRDGCDVLHCELVAVGGDEPPVYHCYTDEISECYNACDECQCPTWREGRRDRQCRVGALSSTRDPLSRDGAVALPEARTRGVHAFGAVGGEPLHCNALGAVGGEPLHRKPH